MILYNTLSHNPNKFNWNFPNRVSIKSQSNKLYTKKSQVYIKFTTTTQVANKRERDRERETKLVEWRLNKPSNYIHDSCAISSSNRGDQTQQKGHFRAAIHVPSMRAQSNQPRPSLCSPFLTQLNY